MSPPLYLDENIPRSVAAAFQNRAPLVHRATVYLPGTRLQLEASAAAAATAPSSSSSPAPGAEEVLRARGSFLTSVLDAVRRDTLLTPDDAFTMSPPSAATNRPRPLYLSTASQIGLVPTPGIPSRVEVVCVCVCVCVARAPPGRQPLIEDIYIRMQALVPRGSESLVKQFLHRLMLHPPPYAESKSLAAALLCLQQLRHTHPMPVFPVMLTYARVC